VNPDHDWDDLADALALVECAGSDLDGFGAVARNMDPARTAVTLAKLLHELVNDNAAGRFTCAACFREWAAEAISRP
jgi:hypothetical protein